MRLWTVQPYCVYELLQKEGVYRCDPKKTQMLQYDKYLNAYKWISNQMRRRIGNPPVGTIYPVWAWYVFEGKNKRPDMRKTSVKVNEKSVIWEVEVPDKEVLLTDHGYWHIALNDSINYKANYKNISDDEWDIEVEKEDKFFNKLTQKERRLYKEKSWESIICSKDASYPYIQATFWEIKDNYIKNAWILKK